jgi:hypothetical protein
MTPGEEYLNELSGFPPKTFPSHFSNSATRLNLGATLGQIELRRLYEAAFMAALCNIAINGLGGCGGRIKPQREPNRRRLEHDFMVARDRLYACAGWQALPPFVRNQIQHTLLRIYVNEKHLAV